MNVTLRARLLGLLFVVLIVCATAAWAAHSTATTKAEAELGAQTAAQIEKAYGLVDDPAKAQSLTDIANRIAPLTERPDVVYTCKILNSGDINAISIPGGTIYFTAGILNALESEDEIAGVMAHEIAHNALYHQRKMMEKRSQGNLARFLTLIAGVYASRDPKIPAGEIISMSDMLMEALVNGYGQDLESEADQHGLGYLRQSIVYDPAGLYSVILGLEQLELSHPPNDPGYLKTHPDPAIRRAGLERRFAELGMKINIWKVVNFRAAAIPPVPDTVGATVRLGTQDIVTLTNPGDAVDVNARVTATADAINARLVRYFLQPYDVDCDLVDGVANIRMRAIPVLTLTQADADAAGVTLAVLGAQVTGRIKDTIWNEIARRTCGLPMPGEIMAD
jgi:Zn-dependent protease with chaperone function